MALPDIGVVVPEDKDYRLITTEEGLEALCQDMLRSDMLGVDTETEGIDYEDIIVGICISTTPGMGAYIPVRHEIVEGKRHPDQLDPTYVFSKIGPILEEKVCTGHNVKFDLKMFWKEGININYVHDTFIMASVIGTYLPGERGLKYLTKAHFNHSMAPLESLFPPRKGSKKVEIRPKELSPQDIFIYGCEDADYSLRLFHVLESERKSRVSETVYSLEMQLVKVVAEMEMFGVFADKVFLTEGINETGRIADLLDSQVKKEIMEAAGLAELEVNLGSYPQLRTVLYEYLKLPILEVTPKGEPSTAEAVLLELAKEHDIVNRILTLRGIKKLRSFLVSMNKAVQKDGRIRGNFNQSGTASGRFSSSQPNLQQIPRDQTFILWPSKEDIEFLMSEFPDKIKKLDDGSFSVLSPDSNKWEESYGYLGSASTGKEYGVYNGRMYEMLRYKTRKFFAAPPDHYIVEADYSQIELRIMAGESQEPTLLDAYEKGDDVHTRTAAVIHGVPFENVTKEQRSVGKTINFGLLYGAGPQRISKELNISVEESKAIVSRYFENLPSILTWINRVKKDAKNDRYSTTNIGRIRYFPDIRSYDQGLRARQEREAVNHVIQGSAADVMKFALVRTSKRMRKYFGDKVKLICTVHDSLMLECHNSIPVEEVVWVLKEAMEGFALSNNWPAMEIDPGYGPSWGDTKGFSDSPAEPSSECLDDLPDVRVEMLGRLREGFLSSDNYFIKTEVEQKTLDSSEGVRQEEPSTAPSVGQWIIEVSGELSQDRLVSLYEFLKDKKVSNDGPGIMVQFIDSQGELGVVSIDGQFDISLSDLWRLKAVVGSCKMRQDLNTIDPLVFSNAVNFGE